MHSFVIITAGLALFLASQAIAKPLDHTCIVGPGPFAENPAETLTTLELVVKPETFSESAQTIQIDVKQKDKGGDFAYSQTHTFNVTSSPKTHFKIFTSRTLTILGNNEVLQLSNVSLTAADSASPSLLVLSDTKPVDILGFAYCSRKL